MGAEFPALDFVVLLGVPRYARLLAALAPPWSTVGMYRIRRKAELVAGGFRVSRRISG